MSGGMEEGRLKDYVRPGWHFFAFFFEPQGHGSFRPTFGRRCIGPLVGLNVTEAAAKCNIVTPDGDACFFL